VFDSLTERLDQALKKLTGRGKLSEADVDAGLREVRLALLEADVNYKVVKDFIASIRARAVGAEVMESLNPGQQLVKIVDEELVRLLGEREPMKYAPSPPTVIVLARARRRPPESWHCSFVAKGTGLSSSPQMSGGRRRWSSWRCWPRASTPRPMRRATLTP